MEYVIVLLLFGKILKFIKKDNFDQNGIRLTQAIYKEKETKTVVIFLKKEANHEATYFDITEIEFFLFGD